MDILSAKGLKFSKKEKEIFRLVKRVKKFAKKIGFEETNNYLSFGETCKNGCTTLYYTGETDLPFSYVDPKMLEEDFDTEGIKEISEKMKDKGIDIRKHSFYLLETIGLSPGALITRRMLNSNVNYVISTIFHEDFHYMTDLPRHIDEASADVVGIIARCLFLGMSKVKIYAELEKVEEKEVIPCILCFDEINKLHKLFCSRKISKKSYLLKTKKVLEKYKYDSVAHVSFLHTYCFYFSLVKKLMIYLDYDVAKFIKIMKNFPVKEGDFPSIRSDEGFKIYLDKEKETSKYLEWKIVLCRFG